MKKGNGFTLAEVLGVIVILSILMVVLIPPIVNQIIKTKKGISSATLQLIYSATESYANKNQNDYPIFEGNVYCIGLQSLVDNNELKAPIKDINTGQDVDLNRVVKMSIINIANIDYEIVKSDNCEEIDNRPIVNSDKSGASVPDLDVGMIPIKWDGSKWVKADSGNPSGIYRWYDYDEQEWANAVLVSSEKREEYLSGEPGKEIIDDDVLAYLVWIPRYRYKIFNVNFDVIQPQEIEIRFESKDRPKSISRTNGEWLTHPAFTFGNIELNGIWVGKFEATGNTTTPTVKPGRASLRGLNVSTQFNTAKKINNPTTYGITTTNDAHMMKPTEWGAVAYLSHSKYGRLDKIWINPSSDYVTGCAGTGAEVLTTPDCSYHYYTPNGQQASTTANVYGIYDMNGGAWDRLMGGVYTSASKGYVEAGHSGFLDEQLTVNSPNFIGAKYIDLYEYGMMDNQQLYKQKMIGDANGETEGWYGGMGYPVYELQPWAAYGNGFNARYDGSIFNASVSLGDVDQNHTFRLVVSGYVTN